MPRKRFSAEEKSLIAQAGKGGRVEWQNVTVWHAAEIVDPTIVTDDGWQHVVIRNLVTTKTISAGATVHVSPGHIRRVTPAASVPAWVPGAAHADRVQRGVAPASN